jgi:hypothetical protein
MLQQEQSTNTLSFLHENELACFFGQNLFVSNNLMPLQVQQNPAASQWTKQRLLQVQQLVQMQMQQRQGRVSNNPHSSAPKLVALLLKQLYVPCSPIWNRHGIWCLISTGRRNIYNKFAHLKLRTSILAICFVFQSQACEADVDYSKYGPQSTLQKCPLQWYLFLYRLTIMLQAC